MRSRRPLILASTAMGTGILGGAIGIALEIRAIGGLGLLLTLAALPVLNSIAARKAQRDGADRLALTFNDGYRLALEHVGHGLLDQHTPRPGHRATGETPDNVIYLLGPAHQDDRVNWKAQ